MKKRRIIQYALVILTLYIFVVFLANRFNNESYAPRTLGKALHAKKTKNVFTVMTWNLGFSVYDRLAEFAPDGGSGYLNLNQIKIKKNFENILATIKKADPDSVLLQEVTEFSALNGGLPMLSSLDAAMSGYERAFVEDFKSKFLPPDLRMVHGLAVYSRYELKGVSSLRLPDEPEFWLGMFKKSYSTLSASVEVFGQRVVLFNVHLAAYDADADVRRHQVSELLKQAKLLHDDGYEVLIGGDWNMLLRKFESKHRTNMKDLGWVEEFPEELLPDGWQLLSDREIATVRQLDGPYEEGKNFTAVIDGFIASRGLKINEVEALDLGFESSDHNPVIVQFQFHE